MQPNLAGPFRLETEQLERDVEHMYCDQLGHVTVAIGRKIDNGGNISAEALTYPFRTGAGAWASESAIREEFKRIKDAGGDWTAAKKIAKLYLSDADRADLFDRVLKSEMEATLVKLLPEWDTTPAEGQWAILSMAWAMGPHYLDPKAKAGNYWPDLHKSLKAHDYFAAAGNCKINGVSSARNRYNRAHFLNAFRIYKMNLSDATIIGNRVLVSSSRVAAAAKSPFTKDGDALLAQSFLKSTGHYTSVLDGLWGGMSQDAWKRYCKSMDISTTYNVSNLTRLAKSAEVDALIS